MIAICCPYSFSSGPAVSQESKKRILLSHFAIPQNLHMLLFVLAEREGFEPSWGGKAPNRFRVGAGMAASVPLQEGAIG